MKLKLILLILILCQGCGTQCGAAKWRNSNKYYGIINHTNIGANVVTIWC